MTLVFFGIYALGALALRSLLARGHQIALVVSKPHNSDDYQPVVEIALSHGLPLNTPNAPNTADLHQAIVSARPDLIVVAGYHKKIPASILEIPRLGAINLHGSLLPLYRGPCPWKHVIMRGECESGVTVHVMTDKLDHGAILKQKAIPISETDTGGSLFEKTSAIGADVLAEAVEEIASGSMTFREQDESLATYYGAPADAECEINWNSPAIVISNLVRGLNPRPGTWTLLGGRRHRIWNLRLTGRPSDQPPGSICRVTSTGFSVATATVDVFIDQASRDGETTNSVMELFADFQSPSALLLGSGIHRT